MVEFDVKTLPEESGTIASFEVLDFDEGWDLSNGLPLKIMLAKGATVVTESDRVSRFIKEGEHARDLIGRTIRFQRRTITIKGETYEQVAEILEVTIGRDGAWSGC